MAGTTLLTTLRWNLAAFGVMARALRLSLLAHKAGFRPDQPRVPAGNPDGGLAPSEITAWHATKNSDYDNLSPREFLRGESREARRAIGLKALRDFGVLKP